MTTEVFKNWPRFDGAAAWAILTPAQQAEIGAIVLEFAVAQHGMDYYAESSSYEARPFNVANLDQLRGKNLACWCPLDQPCHADVLLQLANAPGESDDAKI